MVLLDATRPVPDQPDSHGPRDGPPSAVAVLPSLTRLGIGRLLPTSFWSALPEPAASQFQAFATSPRGARNTPTNPASCRRCSPRPRH